MNRIAQRPFDQATYHKIASDHQTLTSTLRGAVPPSVLGMFPAPSQGQDGQVQWQTLLAGQPRSFQELTDSEKQALLERLHNRVQTLKLATKQLQDRGSLDAQQASHINLIVSQIPRDALVAVGDEPLILYWNSALPPDKQGPLLPLAATTTVAAMTGGRDRRGCAACLWWLLGLLALLALLASLFWFFCPLSPRQAPSLEQDPSERLTLKGLTITVPAAKPVDPLELWQPIGIPVPPDKSCPEPVPCPEPVVCPEPKVCPVPEPVKPEPPQPVAPKIKPAPPKKVVTADNAKEFCPDQRPPDLAPEIVVVFDNSGSMRLNIGTTAAQERSLMGSNPSDLLRQLLSGGSGSSLGQIDREPRRITIAKQAVSDVVRRLPKDVNAGLVTVGSCPRSENRGFFTAGNRPMLLTQIQGLQAAGGTPLADGVLQAGNMLDGTKRESMILVVTDGRESCGGDPCAVARRLAAAKPRLTINVVDIGSSGAGNCLASAARGQVFTAKSINELKLSLEKATQEVQGPKNCK